MEQNYVEQTGHEYLSRIPQEYVEQQYHGNEVEHVMQHETMLPFNKRARIDYSKFGF
jgi:hypothetical protein